MSRHVSVPVFLQNVGDPVSSNASIPQGFQQEPPKRLLLRHCKRRVTAHKLAQVREVDLDVIPALSMSIGMWRESCF